MTVNIRITESDNLATIMPRGAEAMGSVLDDEIGKVIDNIQEEMSVEGSPVTYPIYWDSEEQKKEVIAKLRAEGNLPYQRTGQTQMSWYQVHENGQFLLGNPLISSRYVYGRLAGGSSLLEGGQSDIFVGRWPAFSDVVNRLWENFASTFDALRVKLGNAFMRSKGGE